MPRFIVQRNIAGADKLDQLALSDIARRSRQVISGMDVPYIGVEAYVEGDMVCCVHLAESAEVIYRRAREGGFPADLVLEVGPAIKPRRSTGVLNELGDEFGLHGPACSP